MIVVCDFVPRAIYRLVQLVRRRKPSFIKACHGAPSKYATRRVMRGGTVWRWLLYLRSQLWVSSGIAGKNARDNILTHRRRARKWSKMGKEDSELSNEIAMDCLPKFDDLCRNSSKACSLKPSIQTTPYTKTSSFQHHHQLCRNPF